MPITIEKNVPIPVKNSSKYPWDKMKVGDSFLVEGRTNGAQLCFQANRTRLPKKFISRVVKGKTRVWRTA